MTASDAHEVLRVEKLDVSYGAVRAVQEVSVAVRAGEAVAIIGSNGAGKTSLLRGVMGLEPSVCSDVRFAETKIHNLPTHSIARLGIGYVPEGRELFGELTVEEELLVGGRRLPRSDRAIMLDRVCRMFPRLKERHRQLSGTLSGGEQQMLAIGRILMAKPTLMLLDEPSLGLAPVIQEIVYATLDELRSQGLSMLLVEQNAYRALTLCSRAYVLEAGRITREDSSEVLLGDPTIKSAYLGVSTC